MKMVRKLVKRPDSIDIDRIKKPLKPIIVTSIVTALKRLLKRLMMNSNSAILKT